MEKELHEEFGHKLFLEGKEFKARIAELEKKNAELEKEKEKLLNEGIWCNNRTNALLNVFDYIRIHPDALDFYLKELYDNDFLKVHFNLNKEEVLEDLSCEVLKQRLRAINKPVTGRKAALVQRIRDHEQLKEALYKTD